jgi:hypothetical protein
VSNQRSGVQDQQPEAQPPVPPSFLSLIAAISVIHDAMKLAASDPRLFAVAVVLVSALVVLTRS